MKAHYLSLNQKDRRHYAGIESMKLWLGWDKYIASVVWCNVQTIAKWRQEIKNSVAFPPWKVRQPWWWAKRKLEKNKNIMEIFQKVIAEKTAWSPVNSDIIRTNLRPKEIVDEMKQDWIEVSVYIVKQLIASKKMKTRKLHKGKTLKSVEWRNEQFENIKKVKDEAEKEWNPVISTDTKKKNS